MSERGDTIRQAANVLGTWQGLVDATHCRRHGDALVTVTHAKVDGSPVRYEVRCMAHDRSVLVRTMDAAHRSMRNADGWCSG